MICCCSFCLISNLRFSILVEKKFKQLFYCVGLFEVKSYCQFLDHKAVMYYELTCCVKNNFTYSFSQDSNSKYISPPQSTLCPSPVYTLMKADTKILFSSSSVNQPNEYSFFTLIYCNLCLLCARSAAACVTSA